MNTARVVLIPIDNRPVTYSFPQQVAAAAGLDVIAPPLEMMGRRQEAADWSALNSWLEESLTGLKPDALIVCLDSLFYGGLVASRRSCDPLAAILERQKGITGWKELSGGKTQILAQASIMRIPHYNTSATEPDYWQEYGERIFQWSVLKHKQEIGIASANSDLASLEEQIPHTVLRDFLTRRERNFQVNQGLIERAASGQIDYLVFSQDDTAQYGLNVLERTRLESQAEAAGAGNVVAYAGTDETILALLSRWLISTSSNSPRVSLQFSPKEGKSVVSKFEGQTVGESLSAVSDVIGLDLASREPERKDDFQVIIHTVDDLQGDHLASIPSHKMLDTSKSVSRTVKLIEESQVPIVLCDVAYSNGADPILIDALLERPETIEKLCAYAGWNTTNNTIGSALAVGVAWWYARQNKAYRQEDFKRILFVRFLDDWAYQALIRSRLSGEASDELLQQLMAPIAKMLAKAFALDPGPVTMRLPWKRTFEVEIDLPASVENCSC